MKLHRGIAAGTALALLAGTAQIAAAPLPARLLGSAAPQAGFPLILAQQDADGTECPQDDPECLEREESEADEVPVEPGPEPEAEQPDVQPAPAPEPDVQPEIEPAPEAEPGPASEPDVQPQTEPAPAPEPDVQPQAEPEPGAEAEPAPAPEPDVQPQAEPEPGAEAEPAPVPEPDVQPQTEPEAEAEPAPAPEPDVQPQTEPEAEPAPDAQAEPAPAEQPAVEPESEPADPGADTGSQEQSPPVAEPAESAPEAEAEPVEPLSEEELPEVSLPENAAPVLDSAKEAETAPAEEGEAQEARPIEEEAVPPPVSDEEAQQGAEPVEIQPLRAEEGRRIDADGLELVGRVRRHEGTEVLGEAAGLMLLGVGAQMLVRGDDRPRLSRDAREVYYEELPRDRVRETIVRPNGVTVVTVFDRYGDVIRRSRITPDGREYVLVYAAEREGGRDRGRQWRDPGRDLPPLRLTIPVNQYILDAGGVRNPDLYYDFLRQPPVDRVRRTYSVDEVRYSARIRDSVRRIDLDTVTFDFGSARIGENEIPRLEGIASAMERLLDRDPAEVFLIEGHTDAVGSEQANLALSHRRAQAVAEALTGAFGIPPENLVTQGYGPHFLKIDTAEPERLNRRVAIRRITPLVAPVSAHAN